VMVSFTADETVEEWLERQDNKSEAIREAIKAQMDGSDESGDSGLSSLPDSQREAYHLIEKLARPTDREGAIGRVDGEVIKSELAQRNGVSKGAVWRLIVSPLIRDGWLTSSFGSSLLMHSEPVERDDRDGAGKNLSDKQRSTSLEKDCKHRVDHQTVVAGRCHLCGEFVASPDESDESGGSEVLVR